MDEVEVRCRTMIKGHNIFGLKISHSFDEILAFTPWDSGYVRFAIAFEDKLKLHHLKAVANIIGVYYEFLMFVPGMYLDIDKFHNFTIPDVDDDDDDNDGWDEDENEVECFR